MFDLYLITDPDTPGGLVNAVREALHGAPPGRVAVQLRAKHLPAAEQLDLAHALRAVTRAAAAGLLVNTSAEIARLAHADGVHLPDDHLTIADARAALPPTTLVGVSCHDADGLTRARIAAADFAVLGPVFAVPGKGEALGVARFGALVRSAGLPVFALGGIDSPQVGALRAQGAHGIAAIRAVFAARDRRSAVGRLLAALDATRQRD